MTREAYLENEIVNAIVKDNFEEDFDYDRYYYDEYDFENDLDEEELKRREALEAERKAEAAKRRKEKEEFFKITKEQSAAVHKLIVKLAKNNPGSLD